MKPRACRPGPASMRSAGPVKIRNAGCSGSEGLADLFVQMRRSKRWTGDLRSTDGGLPEFVAARDHAVAGTPLTCRICGEKLLLNLRLGWRRAADISPTKRLS